MKPIKKVTQKEVWDHWKKVEGHQGKVWREDIKSPLPNDLIWALAEITEEDIPKIYIISSTDWLKITPKYKLLDAVDSLVRNIKNEKIDNIKLKRSVYQENLDGIDRRLILVCPNPAGNFTIIEGNKRAVALQSIKKLAGTQIYLGYSKGINYYWWSRDTPKK